MTLKPTQNIVKLLAGQFQDEIYTLQGHKQLRVLEQSKSPVCIPICNCLQFLRNWNPNSATVHYCHIPDIRDRDKSDV
jgi:hypothetical protein